MTSQARAANRKELQRGWQPRLPSRLFLRFLGRRLAALILLGLGITFVAFALTELVPGDPAAANLGQRAIGDPAAVQAFREHYGLETALVSQRLNRRKIDLIPLPEWADPPKPPRRVVSVRRLKRLRISASG